MEEKSPEQNNEFLNPEPIKSMVSTPSPEKPNILAEPDENSIKNSNDLDDQIFYKENDENDEPIYELKNTIDFKGILNNANIISKIIIIGILALTLGLFIGLIISLVKYSNNNTNFKTEKDNINYLSFTYENCTKAIKIQQDFISNLTEIKNQSQNTNKKLLETYKNLLQENYNLDVKINETEKDINNTKFAKIFWKIGTGIGGATTVGGAIFLSSRLILQGSRNSEKQMLQTQYDIYKNRQENAMASKSNFTVLSKNNCILTRTECFNSKPEFEFTKEKIRENCKDGAAYSFEFLTDEKNGFGIYLNSGLPDGENWALDENAFLFSVKEGIIANLRKGNNKILQFPTNKLLSFAEDEVVIYESKYEPARISVNPGKSFEINGNLYHENTDFNIEELIIYKISVNCPKP